LQVVFQSLLLAGPSRRYCLRIFPMMPGPLSRRFAGCTYLFLPPQHRPTPPENGSAFYFNRDHPLKRLHSGGTFRDCSHFFMFRPHSLLATLVARTTAVSCRAVSGFYVRAERASLPPRAPDMLAVRIQVIDSARTFTVQVPQLYRLLLSGCPSATILRPSALTFLEAFQSRRWWVRHPGQVHSRSESERSSFLYPHSEQSFVEGKNLST
jgi:hypothetical protein